MEKISFRCTTQEPLILFKKAKTEQSTETLEYLPGALFRGVVASHLFQNAKDKDLIDDIIFNGSVFFGDANLEINGERSWPVPFSYHKKAGSNDKTVFNLAMANEPDIKTKQIRYGYFVKTEKGINIDSPDLSERMKAARDKDIKATKDGAMFLYRFIEPGYTFLFDVLSEDKTLLEKVKAILNTKTVFLGKSKSAEFGGRAKIEYVETLAKIDSKSTKTKTIFAASNWCFLNEFGNFTATPTAKQFCGDATAKIDWKKTFLRFRTYSPFNVHRQAFDAQRLIIEKGSVVTFENEVEITSDFLEKRIGCFVTEGFGEVIANPDFLKEESYEIVKLEEDKPKNEIHSVSNTENVLLNVLKAKANLRETRINNIGLAENYEFKKAINKSQWAKVYNAIKPRDTKETILKTLFEEKEGILVKSKHTKWDEAEIEVLKGIINKDNTAALRMFLKNKINAGSNE